MKAKAALFVVVLVPIWAGAATTTVYRHVGPDGVVSFSDEALPGATPVAVESVAPHADDIERAGDMFDQQLELISVLEADRRARQAAEAEQRAAELELARTRTVWAAREAAEPEQRYVYAPWYAPRYPYYPGHPHKPSHRPGHDGGERPQPSPPKQSRPLGIGSH